MVQNDKFYLITLLTVRLDEGTKAHADNTQMRNSKIVTLNILRNLSNLSVRAHVETKLHVFWYNFNRRRYFPVWFLNNESETNKNSRVCTESSYSSVWNNTSTYEHMTYPIIPHTNLPHQVLNKYFKFETSLHHSAWIFLWGRCNVANII